MYYKITRTIIEVSYVDANSKEEALHQDYHDPASIDIINETIQEVLNVEIERERTKGANGNEP